MPTVAPPLTPRALRAVGRRAPQRLATRIDCGGDTTAPFGPVSAMGLHFASPIGLAAGFDRAAACSKARTVSVSVPSKSARSLPRTLVGARPPVAGGVRFGVSIGKPLMSIGTMRSTPACGRCAHSTPAPIT